MYVYGSSSSVEKLNDLLKSTMNTIETYLGDLDSALSQVRGGWRDDGVDDVESAVKSIRDAVESSKDGASNVESALEAHADALRSIGK